MTGSNVVKMPCPTCTGPVRETVGMVCQTCGTDYGPDRQPSITLEADDLPAVQDAIREYGDLRAAEALREAAEELTRPRRGLAGLLDMASQADQQRATYARWLLERAAALGGEQR